jgi:hypothetical protein
MASWNLGPMHIFLLQGESGGHGHSMQSSACPDLIGCFGTAIVGSIGTDTESLAIAHYRSEPILAASRRIVPDYLETFSLRHRMLCRVSPHGPTIVFNGLASITSFRTTPNGSSKDVPAASTNNSQRDTSSNGTTSLVSMATIVSIPISASVAA